ncbi:hypothetical protein [Streptomyces sp. NPDC059957]|uniref:hypothetical protein n=1 Tax=unclassified Streptomyces TaxID=2593676 RepID=UPI003650B7AA
MFNWNGRGALATVVVLLAAFMTPSAVAARPTDSDSAPLGTTASGTWWSPGADQFSASSLWFFDPVNEAVPYGWRKDYQPAGTITPHEKQLSFTYDGSGSTQLVLKYPTGTRQSLRLLGYSSDSDVLQVDWEGHVQFWYGCTSGNMPAAAQAACR